MERSHEACKRAKSGVTMSDNSYVLILIQSLEKKTKILDEIFKMNDIQKEILSSEDLNTEAFENNIREKASLIDELQFLDNGFEDVYARVKDELTKNSSEYAAEIKEMKALIQEITDKSVAIQADEMRNKKLAINKFTFEKKKIKDRKTSNRVANEYYKNMSKIDYVDPQMIDKKK